MSLHDWKNHIVKLEKQAHSERQWQRIDRAMMVLLIVCTMTLIIQIGRSWL
jgi:hypothetical protein